MLPGLMQACPYSPESKKFWADAQTPLGVDFSPLLDKKGLKRVQKVVGSILYYTRAVDMTMLMALSAITVEQMKAMAKTMGRCIQLLDYLASNTEVKVRYYASNMVMNIHLDAPVGNQCAQQSMWAFFHGMNAKKWRAHQNKWCILHERDNPEICGGISGGSQTGCPLPQLSRRDNIPANIGGDMGHPQPKTPVHCNNATAVGIVNNTIKRQQSRSMEMRFFGVGNKVAQDMYALRWHPGQENLADYQIKHHIGSHRVAVRPWYLHTENSPRVLPRAVRPSTLKGCVGTLQNKYIRNVSLPRVVPWIQSAGHMTGHGADPDTCYSQVPRVPTWSDLGRLLQSLGKRQLLPLFPCWLM